MSLLHEMMYEQIKDFPTIPPVNSRCAIRLFQSNQYLYILHPCEYQGEKAVWFCKYEKKGEEFSLGQNAKHLIKLSRFPALFTTFEIALRHLNSGHYSFSLPIDFSPVDQLSSYLYNRVTLTLSHCKYPFAMAYDMHIPYSDFQSLVPLLHAHIDDIEVSALTQSVETNLEIV